jgi:hypothetical protein
VVSAVCENTKVVEAGETGFKTATNVEITTLNGVRAVTTTDENVGGDAEGSDGIAENKASIELMMLFVRSVDTVGSLHTDIGGEEVFTENAATEGVVTAIARRKDRATESAEGEFRIKRVATYFRSNRLNGFAGFTGVGDGTGKCAGTQCDCHDKCEECFHKIRLYGISIISNENEVSTSFFTAHAKYLTLSSLWTAEDEASPDGSII